MKTHISFEQAHRDLSGLMDRVVDDCEIVVIDRPGMAGAALIAECELASLLETAHLLESPRNAERLLRTLERVSAGTVPPQTVNQLREEAGLGAEETS
jgi:antitoxin YefM